MPADLIEVEGSAFGRKEGKVINAFDSSISAALEAMVGLGIDDVEVNGGRFSAEYGFSKSQKGVATTDFSPAQAVREAKLRSRGAKGKLNVTIKGTRNVTAHYEERSFTTHSLEESCLDAARDAQLERLRGEHGSKLRGELIRVEYLVIETKEPYKLGDSLPENIPRVENRVKSEVSIEDARSKIRRPSGKARAIVYGITTAYGVYVRKESHGGGNVDC